MIEVRGVSKRYGVHAVVDDVSVQIAKGGLSAVIGPNGAGKSTLSLISRLVKPDAGTVPVDGLDVNRTPSDALAKRLSILRQNLHITARLTVEELVAFGRYPYSKGRPTAGDREHVGAALEYLELGPLKRRFLDESGGQRQRAFVAMVLCQDTDYALLDEPLNSLDLKHAVAMMKRLRRVADELGKTALVVLHDINFASCYADELVAMKAGHVAFQGPPERLMTTPVLRDVYGLEVRVEKIGGHPIGVYFT